MPSSRRKKALTLVELLIAAGLLGIVMTATYSTLILAMRLQQKQDDQVTVFQQAVNGLNRMETALAAGARDSIVVSPTGFVFISAQTPTGGLFQIDPSSGQLYWQKACCFYLLNVTTSDSQAVYNNDTVLCYKEQPLSPPSTTLPQTPLQSVMQADPTLTQTILSRNVYSLTVDNGAGTDITMTIKSLRNYPNGLTVQARVGFRQ